MAYVCNLFFYEPGCFATPATGPSFADGSIFVSSLSSTDTPKYKLNSDFNYDTDGQTGGTFSGLVPGTYTVYARTNNVCRKTLQMVVGYNITYTTRLRVQHASQLPSSNLEVRVDIEDNQYNGSPQYVETSIPPSVLPWRNEGGDNVLTPVIGSELIVTLNSPSESYYDYLNSYDEKRFRATYYVKENGVYVQKWQGFLTPMNSQEEYNTKHDYPVSFTFSDGLQDLQYKEFSDNSGNKPSTRITFLDAIIFCLNKTGLQLEIWDTVNIYAEGTRNLEQYSVLDQVHFDPQVYLQDDGTMEDCLTVLSSIVRNLSARLIQSHGVWMIDCPTLKTGSTTLTRKFVFDGGTIGYDYEAYRIKLRTGATPAPKITFQELSAMKSHQIMYGTVKIVYDLSLEEVNNMLISGNFEDEDIENGQLKNWQIDYLDAFVKPVPSIDKLTDEDRKNVLRFQYDVSQGISVPNGVILSSLQVPVVENAEPFKLRFSFDIFTSPTVEGDYAYAVIDFSLSLDDGTDIGYLQPTLLNEESANTLTSRTINLIDSEYLRTYIDSQNAWKTVTYDIIIDSTIAFAVLTGDLQVKFRLTGSRVWDHVDIASLKAEDTSSPAAYSTITYNNRRRALDTDGGVDVIRCYKLEAGTQVQNYPEIITPDDNLTMVWKLQATVPSPIGSPTFQQSWIKQIMVDNVRVEYLPEGESPQETQESEIVINANVKNPLDITLRHGDLPDDENYKNITHGWLSYLNEDDEHVPTTLWNVRDAVAPPIPLIQLIQQQYRGQYGVDRWKLSGEVSCYEVLPFLGNTIYEVRTGKIYTLVASSIDSYAAQATIEMIESLQGTPVDDIGSDPNPNTEPPVNLREHTDEFTDEFA